MISIYAEGQAALANCTQALLVTWHVDHHASLAGPLPSPTIAFQLQLFLPLLIQLHLSLSSLSHYPSSCLPASYPLPTALQRPDGGLIRSLTGISPCQSTSSPTWQPSVLPALPCQLGPTLAPVYYTACTLFPSTEKYQSSSPTLIRDT